MPTTTQHISGAAPTTDSPDYTLDSIGVELEYPVANDSHPAPAGRGSYSSNLVDDGRSHFNGRRGWLSDREEERGYESGYMGTDHTGAEITSGILELHTEQPEQWYRDSIAVAEELGYPFAATGQGSTNFGLHMHVSEIPQSKVDAIAEMCRNEWATVFFCASVSERSADPWRHGGVSSPSSPWRGPRARGNRHWEFRLPEPMLPEHFDLVMDFWRMVETDGVDYAADVARQLVLTKDERLTAVQQYRMLEERIDGWPDDRALGVNDDGYYTDPEVALWFDDLMS